MRIDDPKLKNMEKIPGIASIDAALAKLEPTPCNWANVDDPAGGWATRCNLMFIFAEHPEDNGYNYCPNCGKKINYLPGIYEKKKKAEENDQEGKQA